MAELLPTSLLAGSRRSLAGAFAFSCAANLLMLTGPLFMLQIYDRVLASRSLPTLVALFILVAALSGFLGAFEYLRKLVLSRIGYRVETRLAPPCYRQALEAGGGSGHALDDLATLRQFIGGNGLIAIHDLPWTPFYLAIVFLLHFWLGLLAAAGAALVVVAALANQLVSRQALLEAGRLKRAELRLAESGRRAAETLLGNGMAANFLAHWQAVRLQALALAQTSERPGQAIGAFSKAVRLLLQSAILALGAWLAIREEITGGVMIAASILAGRALAPIDFAVGNWSLFVRAREAWRDLSQALISGEERCDNTVLPAPKGRLSVEALSQFAGASPGDGRGPAAILRNIEFRLAPGDALGVIGPSACGKTSLARLLVGIWRPDRGAVRLDGATIEQWRGETSSRHIGYLPQTVALFAGTIARNIARFDPMVADEAIIAAARLAGVHEIILRLKHGYDTRVEGEHTPLSGGQIQRVALARTLLGMPALVVLDEPNSNLDAEGEAALGKAILQLRGAGSCVVVMAHRPRALAAVNKLLVLDAGRQIDFGDKAAVLARRGQAAAARVAAIPG
jgi:ATP-binding cassette, subfamily C, bacterial exporter for protease/lipase